MFDVELTFAEVERFALRSGVPLVAVTTLIELGFDGRDDGRESQIQCVSQAQELCHAKPLGTGKGLGELWARHS
nr:hypothetical protein [Propionibacterium freudenreichii]